MVEMRNYMNIIAGKIAHKRKELGITQKELAEKLNVSDKTLSRWETGKQIPDALTVLEIAKALNMTINDIYGIKSKEENTLGAFGKTQGVIDSRRSSADKTTEPQEVVGCRNNSIDEITEIKEDIDYRSLHQKSGIFGKVFKRVVKFVGAGIVGIAMVMVVVIGIINHNLQSKVSYVSGEIAIDELVNHGDNIMDWIQKCNLKGMEINLLNDYIENSETGEITTRYLIYMPHGYESTELDVRYQIGLKEKMLRIEAENTTQIADDNYYFGYVEIMDNTEGFEVQAFLDGESVEYGTSRDSFEVGIVLNGKNVVYGRGEEPKVVNIFE